MRTAEIKRTTRETQVEVSVSLDGDKSADITTPIQFLNHLLEILSFHGGIGLRVEASGDLGHHIIEDIALVLGAALDKALGDRKGIYRFGEACVPMDCSLASVNLDLGGRPYSVVRLQLEREMIEDVASEDIQHFMESLATASRANLHINVQYGNNDHHKVEAAFKALSLALRKAVAVDGRSRTASTKGVI